GGRTCHQRGVGDGGGIGSRSGGLEAAKSVGLLRCSGRTQVALRLGEVASSAVLLHADGTHCGIGRAEDTIYDIEGGRAFSEDNLVVGVTACETRGSAVVAAGAPLYVEGAVGG